MTYFSRLSPSRSSEDGAGLAAAEEATTTRRGGREWRRGFAGDRSAVRGTERSWGFAETWEEKDRDEKLAVSEDSEDEKASDAIWCGLLL